MAAAAWTAWAAWAASRLDWLDPLVHFKSVDPSGQRPTGIIVDSANRIQRDSILNPASPAYNTERAAGTILRPAFCICVAHPLTYHIALGSNLGHRLARLQAGLDGIDAMPESRVVAVSGVWETEAHVRQGSPPQPDYLNAVVECSSDLDPDTLLRGLLEIEMHNGRRRSAEHAWEARTLDLDILAAGDRIIQSATLQLPHPRLGQRRFVLEPFAEIAADLLLPAPFDRTVGYLLGACPDHTAIRLTPLTLQLPRPA